MGPRGQDREGTTDFEPGLRPRRCFSKMHLEIVWWGNTITGIGRHILCAGPLTALAGVLAVFSSNAFHLAGVR